MGQTSKGVAAGLATLDADGHVPASQLGDAGGLSQGEAVADVAEANADGTYDTDTADLINELKTQVNALLASLRDAGLLAES